MNEKTMNMVMEEHEKDISDYLIAFGRHKVLIFSVMALILATSLGLALGLPAVYKSSSTILIEQQEVPQDFVRTLVTSFAEQRIQVIRQKIISTRNLVKLIEKYDLYKEDRKVAPIESVVENMRENISVEMINADVVDPTSGRARSATIAFSLSFEDSSPKIAQSVVNELTTFFLNENIKARTETAIESSAFLETEAGKLRKTIKNLEEKLAEFKEKNAEVLPELAALNLQMMNRVEQDLAEVKRTIASVRERKIYLAAELSQQPETIEEQRFNPDYDLQRQKYEMSLQRYQFESQRGSQSGQLDAESRLEALQAEYLASVAKYSSGHPDVQRLKREIESLRKEVGSSSSNTSLLDNKISALRQKLASAKERYSPDHPDVRRYERELSELEKQRDSALINFKRKGSSRFPAYNITEPQYTIESRPNPAYVQLKSQLDAADSEILSLKDKLTKLESKYRKYELRLTKTPQVERQYRDLVRDYETAQKKYKDITAKQLEAQLAQSLESERKGERFTLIEPPVLPEKPYKPNRLAIAFLGLILSLAGGLGAGALAEVLNDSVRGRHGVMELMGEAPLAAVPFITTAADVRKKILQRSMITFGMVATVLIAAVLVHFYFIPLDVLWFKSLRKFGL